MSVKRFAGNFLCGTVVGSDKSDDGSAQVTATRRCTGRSRPVPASFKFLLQRTQLAIAMIIVFLHLFKSCLANCRETTRNVEIKSNVLYESDSY